MGGWKGEEAERERWKTAGRGQHTYVIIDRNKRRVCVRIAVDMSVDHAAMEPMSRVIFIAVIGFEPAISVLVGK